MKCPECGFLLNRRPAICPRCLTPLTYDSDGQPQAVVTSPAAGPAWTGGPRTEVMPPSEAWSSAELPPAELLAADLIGESQAPSTDAPPRRSFLSGLKLPALSSRRLTVVDVPIGRFQLITTLVLAAVTLALLGLLIISTTRKNPAYYLDLAEGHRANGEYETATLYYRRVLEREPDSATAENGIGWAYLSLERPSQAIPHLKRAVELQPSLSQAGLGLGIAYSRVNMYPEAEASLKKWWEAQNIQAGRQLAWVYVQEQRYDEAISILQTVIQRSPADLTAQDYLGQALYETRRYDEALTPLRAVVEQNPQNLAARERLALTSYALGRCDWAKPHFLALLSAHTQDPLWSAYLGQCLYQEGQFNQAVIMLNHALSLGRTDLLLDQTLLYLARAYYDQSRFAEAAVLFQRAATFDSGNAAALSGMGWCYVKLERCADARPLFERALQLDAYDELAQQGLTACPAPPVKKGK